MPNVKNFLSAKYLLPSLVVVILIYFISQYVAANYGLPKWITIQIKTEKDILLSVYYDVGKGFGEDYKKTQWVIADNAFQDIKLHLPLKYIKSFRIDPMTEPGIVYIKSVKISSLFGKYRLWPAETLLDAFHPVSHISNFELSNDSLKVVSSGNDPYFICTAPVPKFKIAVVWISIILIALAGLGTSSIRLIYRNREKLLSVNPLIWLSFIIFTAFVLRSYHIDNPLSDMHAFRQTQTAGLIRDFYRDGINLLYPRLITLGDPGYVVLEFPLYQALASLLYKFLTPDIIWARLLSISSGLLSILFIYRITLKFADKKAAIFAAFFFAFTPLAIFYNRVPIPDSLTILLSLIMLDCLIEGINNKKTILLILGIFAGGLGMMMKSPYVAPLYLPIAYATYERGRGLKSFLNARFLISFLGPFALMIIWQRHANTVNEIYFNTNDYPFKDLYSFVVVKLHPYNEWYFGTIAQRLDINNYLLILNRVVQEILCIVGVLFLIFGFFAEVKKREGMFFFIWLFSILCSIMLIFKLNLFHNFYQLPLVPILSIFSGVGVAYFIDLFNNKKVALAIAFISICLFMVVSCLVLVKFFEESNNLLGVGQFIERATEKNAMIAVSQPGDDLWSTELMYYSDRRGFNVPHYRLNGEMIGYLRSRSIKYVALVDYDGGDDLINAAVAHCRIVAQQLRVTIYDISSRR